MFTYHDPLLDFYFLRNCAAYCNQEVHTECSESSYTAEKHLLRIHLDLYFFSTNVGNDVLKFVTFINQCHQPEQKLTCQSLHAAELQLRIYCIEVF
jgi:hypothetical protein